MAVEWVEKMAMRVVQPAEKEGGQGQRVMVVVVGMKERRRVEAEGGVLMIGWSHGQDGCRRVVKPRGNRTGGIVGKAKGGVEGAVGRGFRPPSGWSVVLAGPPWRRTPNLHPIIEQENKDMLVIRKADPSKGSKRSEMEAGK